MTKPHHRTGASIWLAFATLLALPATAAAQDATQPQPDAPQPEQDDDDGEVSSNVGINERATATEPDADRPLEDGTGQPERDYSALPRPDQAGGFAIAPSRVGSPVLWFPRAILFVPRLALEVVDAPVRGSLYLYQRYQVGERAIDLFFNDSRTFGIYPVAFIETGFGLNGGLRLVHKDMFGDHESLGLRAGYGGRYRQVYEAKVDSGERLGRLTLELRGDYQLKPRERFFGIGNGDQVAADPDMALLDPIAPGDDVVASRYRETQARAVAVADMKVWDVIHLDARGGADNRDFESTDDPRGDVDIADAYDTSMLPGYDAGTDAWLGEAHVAIDTRRNANRFVSAAVPGAGWLVAGYVGYNAPVTGDRRSFWRSGADVQYYINLFHGSRVIGLRALVDQVHAPADEVPFVYLPSLGGKDLLRGYRSDRFRDRALTMASAEYMWEMSRYAFPFLFVDVGRVQPSLADASAEDLRVGFGGGLQFQTRTSFLMRTHVSSSIDGDVFFNLSFDPVIDARVTEE